MPAPAPLPDRSPPGRRRAGTGPDAAEDRQSPSPHPAPAWESFSDALLQREALLLRVGDGVIPRDLAGLYVDDEELDRIAATLPGLAPADPDRLAPLRARLDPVVDRHRRALHAALVRPESSDEAFARLVGAAHLTPVEAEVLALVAAVEREPRRQRLVAYVQDSVTLPRLTLATLLRLLPDGAGMRALAPDRRLCRAALVEVQRDGPWALHTVSLPDRLCWLLAGDDSPDHELPPTARRVGARGCGPPSPGLLLVVGPDRLTRWAQVESVWPGHGTLVTAVPASPAEWRAVVREATASRRVVVLDMTGALPAEAALWVEQADHLAWVLSSAHRLPLDVLPRRPFTEHDTGDGSALPKDWQELLGREPSDAHRLSRDQLALVARAVGGDRSRLAEGVRRLAGGHLEAHAERIVARRGWSDLVLPDDHVAQLRELVSRHRHRALVQREWGFSTDSSGPVALFAGPSGTGKTLAAEVVAGALGLDLYRIDLSVVVSKYIGETEKNLERVFAAAGAGDAVLFFDEADALFGKRSDVGDAQDRYANIEVAYLLQRLESHRGLVVLATNLRRNLDPAFTRRLAVSVDFPEPDEEQRREIWRRIFPPSAPVGDLDVDFLARQFRVPGGVIRNAALGAAFLAVEGGTVIGTTQVVLALRREFQKLGRLRTRAEFGPYYDLVERGPHAAPAG